MTMQTMLTKLYKTRRGKYATIKEKF